MSKKDILYPYGDEGISLYEYVTINGMKQYIQIRGKQKKNPILLVVHGGPGGALSGLAHVMQQRWEEEFTVVNFDQRNAGKTYLANKEKAYDIGKTGTIRDYMKDIDEVIAYLHTVYSFDKVYLMGFSWGSVIGAEYAKKHSQNIAAYIGVGQLVNFEKGFKLVCEKMKKVATDKSCSKDAEKIEKLIEQYPKENIMTSERMKQVRTFSMLANKYLVKSAKSFPAGAVFTSPFLNFREKKAMFVTDLNLYQKTYETMLSYEFTDDMKFDVPVYFITGEEDINCPINLIREQMENISAPVKKLYTIEHASHMCFYDNPEVFHRILTEIKKILRSLKAN